MDDAKLIEWLLNGDVAIQYQVSRDLLGTVRQDLQDRIAEEGWGKRFLSKRGANGHWGSKFYQPKWISSHYTLLDLRHLNLSPSNATVRETINLVLSEGKAEDGGIPLGPSTSRYSDVCVNSMFLNYASYFGTETSKLTSVVDCILNEIMPDGGFNCRTTRSGARHSSLHSTISALEGLNEFLKTGYDYRTRDIQMAMGSCEEFILLHQLFLSDHTGQIINKDFLKLSYPSRWRYDILRALDYFQQANRMLDERMEPAFQVLAKKRNKNGTWNLQAKHAGQVHFDMEQAGQPSRWNTLRAMRVRKHFSRTD